MIASSVSNGGGASIQAAEGDTTGLIDALVVGEPLINPTLPAGLTISRGGGELSTTAIGRPLYDYTSLANLLQPCAAYAPSLATAPGLAFVPMASAQNRCGALAVNGEVSGATSVDQSNDALARLRAAGWEPESDVLHASLYAFATPAVAVTYANAYARASVLNNLCGFSFATPTRTRCAGSRSHFANADVFANGNGVPPTNGINVIYNDAAGGPIVHTVGRRQLCGAGCAYACGSYGQRRTPTRVAVAGRRE